MDCTCKELLLLSAILSMTTVVSATITDITVYPGVVIDIHCNYSNPFIDVMRNGQSVMIHNLNTELQMLGMEIINGSSSGFSVFIRTLRVNWNPDVQNVSLTDNITCECADGVAPNQVIMYTLALTYQMRLPPPDVQILDNAIVITKPAQLFDYTTEYVSIVDNSVEYMIFVTNVSNSNLIRIINTTDTNISLMECYDNVSIQVSVFNNASYNGERSTSQSYSNSAMTCQSPSRSPDDDNGCISDLPNHYSAMLFAGLTLAIL